MKGSKRVPRAMGWLLAAHATSAGGPDLHAACRALRDENETPISYPYASLTLEGEAANHPHVVKERCTPPSKSASRSGALAATGRPTTWH